MGLETPAVIVFYTRGIQKRILINDFEKPEKLKMEIEKKTLEFINDMTSILDELIQ